MPLDEIEDVVMIDMRSGALSIRLVDLDPGWCRLQLRGTCGLTLIGNEPFGLIAKGLQAIAMDDLTSLPLVAIEGGEMHHALTVEGIAICTAEIAGMRDVAFVRGATVIERVALDPYQRACWRHALSRARFLRRGPPAPLRAVPWSGRRRHARHTRRNVPA